MVYGLGAIHVQGLCREILHNVYGIHSGYGGICGFRHMILNSGKWNGQDQATFNETV